MTVSSIKGEVMFQTNNDADDIGDFLPHLMSYINEGYEKLIYAWYGVHLGDEYKSLAGDGDAPVTPNWTHRALVDYATWCIYRNGNPQKQNRGYPFRSAFEEVLTNIKAQGGAKGKVKYFKLPN